MKIAVAFLLVALSSCFDSSTAITDSKLLECCKMLAQKDLQGTKHKLKDMLCLYQEGKEKNNAESYRKFLTELVTLLIIVGCYPDPITDTEDVLGTTDDNIGNVAGVAGKKLLKVMGAIPAVTPVFKETCQATGKSLQSLLVHKH
ncbi:hypothetical protein XENTR_v10008314 [Xenopus tropicalis]|uniref:Uncharacterized protein LOC116409480 isoform X1 n=1 Tax=Xenopus tropicalis TaxID=8364 RepID=A0A8J1JAF4_XENTR|nr:uncharacterized protein LOC116409480 isoform X1 [Xenopus tropicalis]KAE8614797.1 hypothetical protein XENTR_v10008314 [Xenopus tropicalis]